MTYYVYSTLSCDNLYTGYTSGGADLPQIDAQVHIKGGSNVIDKRLFTPLGVVTEIDESQLAVLEQNEDFKLHKNNGFITIEKRKVDAEVAAANMELKDRSAQITPNDYDADKDNAPLPADVKPSKKSKN